MIDVNITANKSSPADTLKPSKSNSPNDSEAVEAKDTGEKNEEEKTKNANFADMLQDSVERFEPKQVDLAIQQAPAEVPGQDLASKLQAKAAGMPNMGVSNTWQNMMEHITQNNVLSNASSKIDLQTLPLNMPNLTMNNMLTQLGEMPIEESMMLASNSESATTPAPTTSLSNAQSQILNHAGQRPAVSMSFNAHVSNQEAWVEEFSEKIQFLRDKTLQEAHIQLKPHDLGSIHAKMKIVNGVADLNITVQQDDAREMIEEHIEQLKATLAQADIQLGDVMVSQQDLGQAAQNQHNSNGKSSQSASAQNSDTQMDTHRVKVKTPDSAIDVYI
jgi:flagellar hook-length control protein FliK